MKKSWLETLNDVLYILNGALHILKGRFHTGKDDSESERVYNNDWLIG